MLLVHAHFAKYFLFVFLINYYLLLFQSKDIEKVKKNEEKREIFTEEVRGFINGTTIIIQTLNYFKFHMLYSIFFYSCWFKIDIASNQLARKAIALMKSNDETKQHEGVDKARMHLKSDTDEPAEFYIEQGTVPLLVELTKSKRYHFQWKNWNLDSSKMLFQ